MLSSVLGVMRALLICDSRTPHFLKTVLLDLLMTLARRCFTVNFIASHAINIIAVLIQTGLSFL